MDPEAINQARIQQLLEENLEMARETNERVRNMERLARIWFWFRLLIWALVLILPFLFLQSFLETLFPGLSGEAGIELLDQFKGF